MNELIIEYEIIATKTYRLSLGFTQNKGSYALRRVGWDLCVIEGLHVDKQKD